LELYIFFETCKCCGTLQMSENLSNICCKSPWHIKIFISKLISCRKLDSIVAKSWDFVVARINKLVLYIFFLRSQLKVRSIKIIFNHTSFFILLHTCLSNPHWFEVNIIIVLTGIQGSKIYNIWYFWISVPATTFGKWISCICSLWM
jgi:hypothetical protein